MVVISLINLLLLLPLLNPLPCEMVVRPLPILSLQDRKTTLTATNFAQPLVSLPQQTSHGTGMSGIRGIGTGLSHLGDRTTEKIARTSIT